ncbi:hypothetical protein MKX08_005740 [Trichoderma sp. CBMAI-0020]|nr:hypothetical protein MKX08_005740 [Trichoderma sp. CBMAI-0020]
MAQDGDPSFWHLIAHEKFDGLAQDRFQGTSVHLSFTGYKHSLYVGQRSVRDVPARWLKTVISVYDRAKWIADLDIREASMRWREVKIRRYRFCGRLQAFGSFVSCWLSSVARLANIDLEGLVLNSRFRELRDQFTSLAYAKILYNSLYFNEREIVENSIAFSQRNITGESLCEA